jgi:transcriptional regulator with XRE-family HTH domain
MSASKANPTVRRLELAAALRGLRLDMGLSIEAVAAELMCSAAKVSRLETAGRGIQPRDVRDLCRLYKLTGRQTDRLMALAGEARQQAWWHGLRSLPTETVDYMGLEAAAVRICALEMARIHGLLQTSAYTRHLLENFWAPESQRTGEFVSDILESRKNRQRHVRTENVRVEFILDETAVSIPFGVEGDWEKQIDELIEVCDLPNHSVQIVTHINGPYPGIHGTCTYLSFKDNTLPDTVAVEGLLGLFALDKPAETKPYREIFDYISSEVALSATESKLWLIAHRKSWPESHSTTPTPRSVETHNR